MTSIEIFGFIAAFLTSASFLPQAIMVIRTRQTDGLSLLMYSMFTCGIALWLCYGILSVTWPLILANTLTIVLATTILTIIVQNRFRERKSAS